MSNRRTSVWRRPAVLGLACLAASSLLGCKQEAPPPPPTPTVTVATPEVRTVTQYFEYTGNTAAVNRVDVVARVPGILEKMNYEVLDEAGRPTTVEQNQLLFEIEHEQYEIALEVAKAEVDRAKALEQGAQSVFNKVKRAFDNDAATEAEVIESEADYLQRVAERKAAQANVRDAELNLSYTYVRAPIAGEVTRELVDVGTYVGSGGPTVLTTVTQMKPIYVYFDVSEKIVELHLERVEEEGRHMRNEPPPLELATAGDEKGTFSHKGIVDWWDRSVDRGTGTIVVRGRLENENETLVPGLFARVRVPFDKLEDAVLVQEDAIGTDLSGKFMLVVEPNDKGVPAVKKVPVKLLMQTDDGLRVVDGLPADAQYIIEGTQRVIPGMPVKAEKQQPKPKEEDDAEAKPADTPDEKTDDETPAPADQPGGDG